MEEVEDLLRVESRVDTNEVAIHHMLHLRESVVTRGVVLGENAHRPLVGIDDDDCTVGALVDEAQGIANGVGRSECDRGFEDVVTRFHERGN